MTAEIMMSNLCAEMYEPPKLADFNVIVTYNCQTGTEMYYFTRKFRKINEWGDHAFGGNISSLQLTQNCDHVVEKKDKAFKVIKCRSTQEGTTALRLMAEYLESV